MLSRLLTIAVLLPCSSVSAASDDHRICTETVKDYPFLAGQIFILGNQAPPQWFILSRLPIVSGQKVTLAQVGDAEDRLAQLKVFGSAQVKILATELLDPNSWHVRSLIVAVHEKPGNRSAWMLLEWLRWLKLIELE
jgi:hypothetical protein